MRIDIKSDLSERVNYNTQGLPVYFRKGVLSEYPGYAAEKHWHDDAEFVSVLSGKMQYNVNGEIITIEAGNGIFVNSRQFHFGFSPDYTECVFLCVLIHPLLLSASPYIEQEYVIPILKDVTLPYLTLHGDIESERRILNMIADIFSCGQLEQVIIVYRIWNELYKNRPHSNRQPFRTKTSINNLKNMITFIQHNYKNKLRLADIAKAGFVGKTECCNIFRSYTGLTPIAFLNDFRLRKSAELLEQTDMTVSEICYEVGFSGASYYIESFGKTFRCSPKEYKKSSKNTVTALYTDKIENKHSSETTAANKT